MRSEGPDSIVIEDMSVRRLESILNGVKKYNVNGYHAPNLPTKFYEVIDNSDNESMPFTVMRNLYLRHKEEYSTIIWNVGIQYVETKDEQYDFTKMMALSTATEFKPSTYSPKREVRFKLDGSWGPQDRFVTVYPELLKLEALYKELDALSADIDSWVQSRRGMVLKCGCSRGLVAIPNEKLAEWANSKLTLQAVKEKLVCQECKERPYLIMPTVEMEHEKIIS